MNPRTVRVAVVTGAGSGIGRAVAIGLSADGFAVVLAGRRRDALVVTSESIATESLVQPTDVCDVASVDNLFAAVGGDGFDLPATSRCPHADYKVTIEYIGGF